ncbi:hypothetical protein [Niabella hibiscisoli]|uniref:hypothetical protein n=1 Tax=Niabella hibiscisoli TaxID=1825928 RepID=UPI001F0F0EB6|nr:hypothetical protein [Niabella hibiscisoli]MCH5716074.1 hypothetical protein [Niabella hibiscisoli]
MEKQFLQLIHDHQGIIYKVSALYRNSKEDREDLFRKLCTSYGNRTPVSGVHQKRVHGCTVLL